MMAAMLTLILTGLLRGVRTQHALVLENLALRHRLGRPPTDRAASTPAPLRPAVLGPARPPVARLGGGRRHRPTRHCGPMAAVRLQALLDLEEPPEWTRPPSRHPGTASAHPHGCKAADPLWDAPSIHGELQNFGSPSRKRRYPSTLCAIGGRHRRLEGPFSTTTWGASSPSTSSSCRRR